MAAFDASPASDQPADARCRAAHRCCRSRSLDDATASFADLARRIAAAVAFLKSVDAEAVNRGEDKDITFPLGDEQRTMKGRDYIQVFILPNFFFSVTTAYNILRNNGVALDRQDFVGGI